MFIDARGLTLTTESETAASHYNAAIDEYFEYRLSTGKRVKEALEADPGFAMAHCLQGYLFMLFGTTTVLGRARAALAQARAAAGDRISVREATHIAALDAWIGGDMVRTCAIWDQILLDHPRDLLALRLQHFALFWMGRSAELRSGPAGVLHAWDEGLPGYGNLLGMLSFGHEECGAYAEAEAAGRKAMELNGEDLWALHAVAHVLEMQGRLGEGAAWLDYPDDAWDDRNPFRGHLWWHRALFFLERGDYDEALALYDRAIHPDPSDFYLDIQNAAAMLARLEFLGVELGARWADLADQLEGRLDDHVLAFTDANAMMALAAAGRGEAAGRLLTSLKAFAATPGSSAATAMEPVTIPVCAAILAYHQGKFGRAVDLLLPLRHAFIRMGASHAQRDIFHQYLIEAAIADGRLALARALLSERSLAKPHSLGSWNRYAAVLDSLGETGAASVARERGAAVGAVRGRAVRGRAVRGRAVRGRANSA